MSFGEDLLESARQRDRDRIDAARYRWWRQYAVQTEDCSHDDAFMECETPEQLDALIDVARGVRVDGEAQGEKR